MIHKPSVHSTNPKNYVIECTKFYVTRGDLKRSSAPLTTVTISAPSGMKIQEILLAPQGDRVMWLGTRTNAKNQSQGEVSLWVSRLNGKKRRELGTLTLSRQRGNFGFKAILALGMLAWTPDGKQVSFLHDKALWTVPVD